MLAWLLLFFIFFFFNDTATTEIYTLSLHDALPISSGGSDSSAGNNSITVHVSAQGMILAHQTGSITITDRKSTRLNSSHLVISYAVFCLKNKKSYTKTHLDHGPDKRYQVVTAHTLT